MQQHKDSGRAPPCADKSARREWYSATPTAHGGWMRREEQQTRGRTKMFCIGESQQLQRQDSFRL
jgi:hypothetical protein